MENFDSLVAKYINKNPNADLSSIKEQMENIHKAMNRENRALFSFADKEGATLQDITKFINSSKGSSLEKEAKTLFEILDQDGSGKLDSKELDVLKRRDGTIDSFSFWSKLTVNEDKINKHNAIDTVDNKNTSDASDKEVKEKNNSKTQNNKNTNEDDNMNNLAQKIVKGEDKLSNYSSKLSYEDYKKLEELVNKLNESNLDKQASGKDKNSTADKDMQKIAEKIAKGEDKIENYKSKLSYDQYKQLEELVNKSDKSSTDKAAKEKGLKNVSDSELQNIAEKIVKGEDKIENYASKLTYEKYMQLQNTVKKLVAAKGNQRAEGNKDPKKNNEPEKPVDKPKKTIEDSDSSKNLKINIKQCVEDLHNAMKVTESTNSELRSILFDEEISDDDFVAILKMYEQQYGYEKDASTSFLTDIKTSVIWRNNRIDLYEKLAERLSNAANKGNNDAIKLIAKESYYATNGLGTNDWFLEKTFNSLDTNIIGKISKLYSSENKGRSLLQDIKDDYIIPSSDNGIIDRIKKAQRFYVE